MQFCIIGLVCYPSSRKEPHRKLDWVPQRAPQHRTDERACVARFTACESPPSPPREPSSSTEQTNEHAMSCEQPAIVYLCIIIWHRQYKTPVHSVPGVLGRVPDRCNGAGLLLMRDGDWNNSIHYHDASRT
jgi:hypothetical protein